MVEIDMVDMGKFFYPSQPWLLPSYTPVEDTIQPFSSISTLHNIFRHSGHVHMSLFIEYEQNLQAQILLSYWKVKVKFLRSDAEEHSWMKRTFVWERATHLITI